jgi:hypothetical protein
VEGMNINIDGLVREAELQQQLWAAQNQLARNLSYFESAAPDLYQVFRDYVPSRFEFQLTAGHWDIVNVETGTTIYQTDPVRHCQTQVTRFIQTPYCYRITLMPSSGLGTEMESHIGNINPMHKLLDEAVEAHPEPRKPPINLDCPLMVVNGIGLGYHLHSLLEKTCVHHLCVVEPEIDIFYASLHAVDWREICETFNGDKRSLNLVIAQSPEAGANQLMEHVNNVGIFNCARTYIFSHLKNTVLQETIDSFVAQLTTKVSGLGYVDDERIGLAHTIENLRRGTSLLDLTRSYPGKLPQVPIFVVANGPSLDKAKDLLLASRDHAIIMSCGTALGSLYRMGIKPDFHVEMERTRPVVEWIETSTDKEFRKNIVLLGLNTIHPEVFNYFDNAGVALKTNDVGSLFILEKLGRLALNAHLERCNPTVGNTGLAFAVALGFKTIYLAGLDLGFATSGQHHSSYSAHYRVKEEDVASLDLRTAEKDGIIKLPGNFGGEIVATAVYAAARINAQRLLSANASVKCYNTSDGALIEGATPIQPGQVKLSRSDWNKSAFIDSLLRNHRLPDLKESIPNNDDIGRYFQPVNDTFAKLKSTMEVPITSIAEGWNVLQTIYNTTMELKQESRHSSIHCLVKGSIDSFSLVLSRSLYIYADEKEVVAFYNQLVPHFIAFLQQAVQSLQSTLFNLDQRERGLANKLKK